MILRQSTAFTETVGPILDADGVEYTGAVIGDLSISKNGTEAAMAAAATLTHTSNGHYALVGTTGNSDTCGRLTIRCNKAAHQMPTVVRQVVEEAVYDALFAASALGYVANQPVDLNTIKTQTVTCGAGVTVLASVGTAATSTAQTGDNFAILNSGTHGNAALKTLIDAVDNFIDTEIGDIQSRLPAALTADGNMKSDMLRISGDATAADNCESYFDGSGYGDILLATTVASVTAADQFTLTTGPTLDDALTGHVLELQDAGSPADKVVGIISSYTAVTKEVALIGNSLITPEVGDRVVIRANPLKVVGSIGTGVITGAAIGANAISSTKIAANAIGAAQLAADAATEIGTAVWVSGTRTLTAIDEDSTTLDLDTTIRAALGMASANLDTQLGAIDDLLDTEIAAILAAVDTEIAAIQASLAALWTTALTESYNADGAAPTPAQTLMGIYQALTEGAISGTGWTVKRLDGSTTAYSITLDSATTPTSKTRSS